MAFKLAPKRQKVQDKHLAAFADDDDDNQALPGRHASTESIEDLKAQGSEMAEQGDLGGALNCWQQAVRIDPTDGSIYEMQAQVTA